MFDTSTGSDPFSFCFYNKGGGVCWAMCHKITIKIDDYRNIIDWCFKMLCRWPSSLLLFWATFFTCIIFLANMISRKKNKICTAQKGRKHITGWVENDSLNSEDITNSTQHNGYIDTWMVCRDSWRNSRMVLPLRFVGSVNLLVWQELTPPVVGYRV